MQSTDRTRRDLLKSALAFAAASPLAGLAVAADGQPELIKPATRPTLPAGPDPRLKGLRFGVASYTFRKLPLEQTIKSIQRLGLRYVSIKDFHLAMKSTADERRAVARQFKDAGITPLSAGNVRLTVDEAASRNAFEYCRDAGIGVMVCAPDPAALPTLEKLVKEFDVKLAIHNHGPEDKVFPGPHDVMAKVRDMDPRVGLCIDVGHTARAGVDPAKAMVEFKDRLYDVHFKDVTDVTAKNTRGECEVGRGAMDVPAMLRALLEIRFAGHVGFEYEKDPADPLPGLAESVGYVRGALAAMPGTP